MATLLQDPDIGRYDILAVQEPWKNPFDTTTRHPAKDRFHLCYPGKDQDSPARVCFFIDKRLDHSKWHFKVESRDLCSLDLEIGAEEEQHIMIHNVYNPTQYAPERRGTLPLLDQVLELSSQHEQVIVGDFNLHHELWGGDRIKRADPNAAELITIMEDHYLTSNLTPGTITYEERDGRTTIDLCLTTPGLADRLIRCETAADVDHDSDHLPIVTSLDLTVVQLPVKTKRNWKAIDEKAFVRCLRRELPPQRRPRTRTDLDRYVGGVMAAISTTVEEAVPKINPSTRSEPGWNEECAEALAESKRLRRQYSLYHTEEAWEAYRASRNHKSRVVRKILRQIHRDKVEEAAQSAASLWRLAKWARNRHNQSRNVTPALIDPATRQQAITTGEIMEVIVAKRLSYVAKTHGLLPDTHMSERKLRSTEHAFHLIIDKIHNAWKVASLLLLDVSRAFDDILHILSLHNLRKRTVEFYSDGKMKSIPAQLRETSSTSYQKQPEVTED